MEVLAAINARTSVRKFKPDPVTKENIETLLEAALKAPSAGNIQPWFFYVVTNGEMKRALTAAALGQSFIAFAPVVVVVCVEPEASGKTYGDRGRNLYCLQDAAAAVENMMLAAVSLGLGTCWVGAFDEVKVAGLLEMPAGRRPVAIVPVGYPEKVSSPTSRKALRQVVEYRE